MTFEGFSLRDIHVANEIPLSVHGKCATQFSNGWHEYQITSKHYQLLVPRPISRTSAAMFYSAQLPLQIRPRRVVHTDGQTYVQKHERVTRAAPIASTGYHSATYLTQILLKFHYMRDRNTLDTFDNHLCASAFHFLPLGQNSQSSCTNSLHFIHKTRKLIKLRYLMWHKMMMYTQS